MPDHPKESLPPLPPPDGDEWRPGARRALDIAGWLLILLWCLFWLRAMQNGRMGENWIRIPAWHFLGLDFVMNYLGVHAWLDGLNPYRDDIGDRRGAYAYPPIVLLLYAWTRLMGRDAATFAWMGFIAVVMAAGTSVANRVRRALELAVMPLVFVVAVVLWSMPVIFAMERGQGDAICLAAVVAAALALRRPASWGRDAWIGLCLAVATWVKIYPGFAILGLLALGAWRAFGLSIVAGALIALVPLRATLDFLEATAQSQQDRINFVKEITAWLTDPNYQPAQLSFYAQVAIEAHSLTTYWAAFWNHFGASGLARVPGTLGAGLLLFPPALWLSYVIYKLPDVQRRALAYPFLLWMSAMGTFWMPVSFDYNLLYLVLVIVTVCAWRDPWVVKASLVATLLWWQPILFGRWMLTPVMAEVFIWLKVLSLLGVGVSLARRAGERSGSGEDVGDVQRLAGEQQVGVLPL